MKSVNAFWLLCSLLLLGLWIDRAITNRQVNERYERIEQSEKKNEESFNRLMDSLNKIQSNLSSN